MADEDGFPVLVRDEDPWQAAGAVRGTHLRVWRRGPGRVAAVISGPGAWAYEEAVARLRDEYPHDAVELYHHHPGDWTTAAFYARLTVADDGAVTRTRLFGDELARRLGPSLYATEDVEDETAGYGGP
ncbi:hypothetical protein [Streptomyces sp. NPDC006193]|uniref:hypothetical protein n=1 Tax=Streptomyces sp. NPDC006193 TaxID=3155717 RepID=UPI0033B9B03B